MDKEFKKYISGFGPGWMIVTIIFTGLFAASIISQTVRNGFENIVPPLFVLIVPLISLIRLLLDKKFLDNLVADPSYPAIEAEFKCAKSMIKDRVRLGENYIFTKHSGKLLKYSEISKVYQYIHKTNFAEDERALKYINTNGKHRKLCKLDLRGKSDAELQVVVSIIMSKNPNVTIGYR